MFIVVDRKAKPTKTTTARSDCFGRFGLNRQLFAVLLAAGTQNGLTVLGAHTQTKTVLTGMFARMRLMCSFRHYFLILLMLLVIF
jgi:hypothetical protein